MIGVLCATRLWKRPTHLPNVLCGWLEASLHCYDCTICNYEFVRLCSLLEIDNLQAVPKMRRNRIIVVQVPSRNLCTAPSANVNTVECHVVPTWECLHACVVYLQWRCINKLVLKCVDAFFMLLLSTGFVVNVQQCFVSVFARWHVIFGVEPSNAWERQMHGVEKESLMCNLLVLFSNTETKWLCFVVMVQMRQRCM